MEKQYDRIILGVDPGTQVMGYGIVGILKGKPEVITLGVVRLLKTEDHFLRIRKIFEETVGLIERYHPDELSIEAPFFGKNVQSMLKLGRAQGVAIAAALSRELPVFEYSPKRIKQLITGNGSASKEQVAGMLQQMFRYKETPSHLDATDGLAAAVSHFFEGNGLAAKLKDSQKVRPASKKSPAKKKAYTGWESYIAGNPDRVQAK
jgi:crossover junction endodeoxyribonuclease RuvC